MGECAYSSISGQSVGLISRRFLVRVQMGTPTAHVEDDA